VILHGGWSKLLTDHVSQASGRPVIVGINIGLSQFRPAIASITSHLTHVGRVIIVLVGHTQRTTERENPVNPAIGRLSLILCCFSGE
jgi:hypothetical protein